MMNNRKVYPVRESVTFGRGGCVLRWLLGSAAVVVLGLLSLLLVMVVRALRMKPAVEAVQYSAPMQVDRDAVIQHIAGAIRIQTISEQGKPIDLHAMSAFADYLEKSFPRVHAKLAREVMPDGALLYTWRGRDESAPPVVLMAHFDVVPVEQKSVSRWSHAPFSGDIADDAVWGRGAIDDKGQLVALMEAAETLLGEGFTPARTILFAFGDDEENGGVHGAKEIIALLRSRNVHPAMVLDEGGFVIANAVAGLNRPVAFVGVAEKGYLDITLRTRGAEGHSSAPPRHTAIGEISAALTKLEDRPFPYALPEAGREQLETLAPYLPFSKRLLLSNLWLTRGLVVSSASKSASGAAGYHTTVAETTVSGGVKQNVLPTDAEAGVNLRIVPGETIGSVLAGVRRRIEDPGVTVSFDHDSARNPSPLTPTNSDWFHALSTTIRQTFPDAIVSPYLVIGATDSAYYAGLSNNIFRFAPLALDVKDLTMFHGTNERIREDSYLRAVQFDGRLLQNLR